MRTSGGAWRAFIGMAKAIAERLVISPPVDPVTWMEANLRIEAEGGGTVPLRMEDVPALIEPLQTMASPGFTRGCMVKPAQAGATTVLIIGYALYRAVTDPVPILATFPTVDDAQKWSKTKLDPVLDASPEASRVFAKPERGKDKRSTILVKRFINGILYAVGVNSPRMMRMISAGLILNDEVSAYPRNSGGEGSPLAKSWMRASSYEEPKQMELSTPLLAGDCMITERYEKLSDRRIHEVPCPHCHEFFVPQWGMVHWEKTVTYPDGRTERVQTVPADATVLAHHPETAHLVCPLCATIVEEKHRKAMVRAGRYRVRNPERSSFPGWKFGFFSVLMPGMRLPALVARFVAALVDDEAMQQFVNEVEAEVYSGAGSTLDIEALADRREVYPAEVPSEVGYLTGFVDVQGDRIELLVVGWGAGQECWVIHHVKIPGEPLDEHDQCWRDLTAWRQRPWRHADGAELFIQRCGIDRGYAAESVEAYARAWKHQNVVQTRGVDRFDKPVLVRKATKKKGGRVREVPLYFIGTVTAKDRLFMRLRRTSGPGAIHHPVHVSDEFLGQYKAEVPFSRRIQGGANKGKSVRGYRQLEERNEAIDLMVGNMAMLALAGDAVRANLAALAVRAQAEGRARSPVAAAAVAPSTRELAARAAPAAPESAEVPERPAPSRSRRRGVISRGLGR